MKNEIRFLHNSAIDTSRWDSVLNHSVNSRVYANSWFLDILHPDWYGIVAGDYEHIMPVVYSQKWGIKYSFQPVYAQQHGIFPPASQELTGEIFQLLQKKFSYIDISLNSYNHVVLDKWQVEERKNYILPLEGSYQELFRLYTNGCKNNLKKAVKLNTVMASISKQDLLNLSKHVNHYAEKDKPYRLLKLLVSYSMHAGIAEIYGAYSPQNELTGAAFFIKHGERYVYLCSFSTKTGKQHNSMFAIIDTFIRDHSGQKAMLDFEGSTLPGIAYFFGGFGAKTEIYQHVKLNNLPGIIKLFKR